MSGSRQLMASRMADIAVEQEVADLLLDELAARAGLRLVNYDVESVSGDDGDDA